VRPERVRIDPAERPTPDGGTRLEGVLADVVYLGSLTQFHVDTKLGRVVSFRMNDEGGLPLEAGRNVVLTWPAEYGSVLADSYKEPEPV
jgi:ABC-type Fe3+/spermidine/putrescine transport system ATPase subunit